MKTKRGKCFNSLRIHVDSLNLLCPEITHWVAHHLPVHMMSENLKKKQKTKKWISYFTAILNSYLQS